LQYLFGRFSRNSNCYCVLLCIYFKIQSRGTTLVLGKLKRGLMRIRKRKNKGIVDIVVSLNQKDVIIVQDAENAC
jgi:hypothetical protein